MYCDIRELVFGGPGEKKKEKKKVVEEKLVILNLTLLVLQLEMPVLMLLLVYFGIVTTFYFTYSIKNSVGNNIGWRGESGEGGGRGGEIEMNDKGGLLNSSGGSEGLGLWIWIWLWLGLW